MRTACKTDALFGWQTLAEKLCTAIVKKHYDNYLFYRGMVKKNKMCKFENDAQPIIKSDVEILSLALSLSAFVYILGHFINMLQHTTACLTSTATKFRIHRMLIPF